MPIAFALILSLLAHGSALVLGELSLPGGDGAGVNEPGRIDAHLVAVSGKPPAMIAAAATKPAAARQHSKSVASPKPSREENYETLRPPRVPSVEVAELREKLNPT